MFCSNFGRQYHLSLMPTFNDPHPAPLPPMQSRLDPKDSITILFFIRKENGELRFTKLAIRSSTKSLYFFQFRLSTEVTIYIYILLLDYCLLSTVYLLLSMATIYCQQFTSTSLLRSVQQSVLLNYSPSAADHGRYVCFCLFLDIITLNNGCQHDHGLLVKQTPC